MAICPQRRTALLFTDAEVMLYPPLHAAAFQCRTPRRTRPFWRAHSTGAKSSASPFTARNAIFARINSLPAAPTQPPRLRAVPKLVDPAVSAWTLTRRFGCRTQLEFTCNALPKNETLGRTQHRRDTPSAHNRPPNGLQAPSSVTVVAAGIRRARPPEVAPMVPTDAL